MPITRRGGVRGLLRLLVLSFPILIIMSAQVMAQATPGLAAQASGCDFRCKVGATLEELTHGVLKNPHSKGEDFAARIKEVEKRSAELDTERSSRQLDARSLVSALANLVDQPSATPLFSLAKGSGVFESATKDNNTTLTTNFYSLVVLTRGLPKTMPEYAAWRNWRHLTFSYTDGQKEIKTSQGAAGSAKLTSWAGKWQFGSRDLRNFYVPPGANETLNLYSRIINGLIAELQNRNPLKLDDYTEDEIKAILEEDPYKTLLAQFVEKYSLDVAKAKAQSTKTGSASFTYTKVKDQQEQYQFQIAVLIPLAGDSTITINGSADRTKQEPGPAKKLFGGTGAVEVARVLHGGLLPDDGAKLSFSANANGAQQKKPEIKAQAKLEFLIKGGAKVPLSVTWANRSDLIKEHFIRGYVGLSFDAESLNLLRVKSSASAK